MGFKLNDKEGVLPFIGRTCGLLGDSCGSAELSWRNPDDALEMVGELALVGEAGAGGDLRQRKVASLKESLGPFNAAYNDVLVRRQPGGHLELPREVVDAETGDGGQLLHPPPPASTKHHDMFRVFGAARAGAWRASVTSTCARKPKCPAR